MPHQPCQVITVTCTTTCCIACMLAMKILMHASPALPGSHCHLQHHLLHCMLAMKILMQASPALPGNHGHLQHQMLHSIHAAFAQLASSQQGTARGLLLTLLYVPCKLCAMQAMCHASCDAAFGLQSAEEASTALLLSAFCKLDTQQSRLCIDCCGGTTAWALCWHQPC